MTGNEQKNNCVEKENAVCLLKLLTSCFREDISVEVTCQFFHYVVVGLFVLILLQILSLVSILGFKQLLLAH